MRSREPSLVRFALGRATVSERGRPRELAAAGLVATLLGLTVLLPFPATVRPALALVILGLALVARRRAVARSALRSPQSALVIDAEGARREDGAVARTLVRFAEPFGVTLLATRARDRLVVAMTTRAATRYVGVHLDAVDASDIAREAASDLLARSSVGESDDLRSAAGDDTAMLAPEVARAFVDELNARAPDAFERIYLTAPRGEPVELEDGRLRAGDRSFDLGAPLEWRAFCFQESGGLVTSAYQATWMRQADAELVLVAPAAEDLGVTDEPPPRELRLAVDRVFMAPLRRALERAPRASRPNVPVSRPRSERRA